MNVSFFWEIPSHYNLLASSLHLYSQWRANIEEEDSMLIVPHDQVVFVLVFPHCYVEY
jgi:hypothetical protein